MPFALPPPAPPAPLAPRDARDKSSVEGAVGARSYDANGEASRGDAAAHSSGRERAEAMRTEDADVGGSGDASDGGVVNVGHDGLEASDGVMDGDASEPKGGGGTLSWASLVKKGPPSGAPPAAPSGQGRVAGKSLGEDAPADGTGGWGDEDDEGEEEDDEMAGMNGGGGFDPSLKDDQPSTSIYVKNFATSTTEEQLQELFLKFGTIKNISVKLDRGFAFVDFHEPDAVAQVLAAAPDTFLLDGKRMIVEERQSRDSRPPAFRGSTGRSSGRFAGRGGRPGGRGFRGASSSGGGGRAAKTA